MLGHVLCRLAHSDVDIGKPLRGGPITDLVGGRSGKYEEVLARARKEALAEMRQEALSLGGNGVIGVDIDYEVLGQNGSMLMVSVSGTAVVLA